MDEVYAAIDALDSMPDVDVTAEPSMAGGEATTVATVSEQVLSDIGSEIKRSLLFYENQMDGEPVDRVLLAGGSALLPGVLKYFENNLDVAVHLMQPLEKIESDFSIDLVQKLGPTLATGVGLALRCAA